jgi:hypothetical protein
MSAQTLFLCCLAVLGCHRAGTPDGVVARVGDEMITTEHLRSRIRSMSESMRAQYSTTAEARRLLNGEIDAEAVAQDARRRGYEKDPEFRRIINQQLMGFMLQKEVEALERGISGPDVDEYLRKHAGEIGRPGDIRSHVEPEARRRLLRDLRVKRMETVIAEARQRQKIEVNDRELERAVSGSH